MCSLTLGLLSVQHYHNLVFNTTITKSSTMISIVKQNTAGRNTALLNFRANTDRTKQIG